MIFKKIVYFKYLYRFSMGQENQENFLGRGGFGEVYKGFWRGQDIGKEHVLKNYEYIRYSIKYSAFSL